MSQHIDPKPTTYRGTKFKSRLEARWAVFFDHCANVMNWTYEPVTLRLPAKGWEYTPDFALDIYCRGNKGTMLIEVKPSGLSPEHEKFLQQIIAANKIHLYVLCGQLYGERARIDATWIENGKSYDNPIKSIFSGADIAYRFAINHRFDLRT